MNFSDDVQRNRLFSAMKHSYQKLRPFRNLTHGLIREYAGSGYGDNQNQEQEIVLNLMNQAVDAYTMKLVANAPRVLVTSKVPELEPFTRRFQYGVNQLIREIRLEETLYNAVLDAFFCIGIVKIHFADSVQVEVEEGVWMDPGLPFASNVPLDNWCYDTTASEWHKIKWSADCYRIAYEDLKSDVFDQSVAKFIRPSSKQESGEAKLSNISIGTETDLDELYPMVDMMDVWVPREKKVFTFAMHPTDRFFGSSKPVAVLDWDGPESGIHKILAFNEVPENIMPTAPAAHLAALSRLINSLMRKQRTQANRQKDIMVYSPAAHGDANRMQASGDGQSVMVTDPREVEIKKMGGVDPGNHAFLLGAVEMFDRMAGNLTAMLGLGSQAETASQERLIHGAVGTREAYMQGRVVKFTKEICHDIGWMLWNDVAKEIPGRVPIEGADGYTLDATWRADQREGDFYDYDFDIDVSSMPYRSPGERMQLLMTLLTQVYAPMSQQLMAEGGFISMEKLTNIFSELADEPRLKEMIQFNISQMGGGGSEEGGGLAPATSREYIRRSVPTGGTAQNRSRIAQSEWINRSGQNNQDQTANASA